MKRKLDYGITIRPICITFGSPLVGDKALESAISERLEWKSSFLSVVSTMDPVASFFSSGTLYKPFGTFLFFTQSGGHTTFANGEAILAVLDKMPSRSESSPSSSRQLHDYKNELSSIRSNVLCRGVCKLTDELDKNALRAGITLQFLEVGVSLDNIPNDLIKRLMEGEHEKMKKRMNAYSEDKKLSKMKIEMAFMEWYISYMRSTNRCYYDCYKSAPREENPFHDKITEGHRGLNQYWEEFVGEKERMPQKEDANLHKRWLYSGNNYRRMFEPLDIAEYYKKGNTNYIENRPNRYKLLEEWWNVDKKNLNPNERKAKGPNVNDDSCFWAHVEEALISLRILTNGSSSSNEEYEVEWKLYKFATYVMRLVIDTLVSTRNLSNGSSSSNKEYEAEQKLDKFMDYVMRSINDHSLSSDTFLEGSSFMQWWNEYNAYKTGLCTSKFAEYMKSGGYKSYK
ncbi:putative carboxylesterase [Helianthus debilis subsp. tardiflorus]